MGEGMPLCSPGWPQTCYPSVSAFQVLGWQECSTTPSLLYRSWHFPALPANSHTMMHGMCLCEGSTLLRCECEHRTRLGVWALLRGENKLPASRRPRHLTVGRTAELGRFTMPASWVWLWRRAVTVSPCVKHSKKLPFRYCVADGHSNGTVVSLLRVDSNARGKK